MLIRVSLSEDGLKYTMLAHFNCLYIKTFSDGLGVWGMVVDC